MKTNTPKLLDVAALAVGLPQYNLWRGQVGTVVELLADGTAFEVEFRVLQGSAKQCAMGVLMNLSVYVQSK